MLGSALVKYMYHGAPLVLLFFLVYTTVVRHFSTNDVSVSKESADFIQRVVFLYVYI